MINAKPVLCRILPAYRACTSQLVTFIYAEKVHGPDNICPAKLCTHFLRSFSDTLLCCNHHIFKLNLNATSTKCNKILTTLNVGARNDQSPIYKIHIKNEFPDET